MKSLITIFVIFLSLCYALIVPNMALANDAYHASQKKPFLLIAQNDTGRSLGAQRKQQKDTANSKRLSTHETKSFYYHVKTWIYKKQVEVTRELSGYLKKLKETKDITFAYALIFASLIYGLVHAAGPGHGKVVVTSYVMANHQTMRRGIFLAFLSAFVQGTVAIILVSSLAIIFGATGSTIKSAGHLLTQLSYGMIILLGVYLLFKTLQPIVFQKQILKEKGIEHDHSADHDCSCSHKHIPDAGEIDGNWSLAKITALTLSVGLRPCTGAIFVLVFALLKGLFWIGAIAVYAMALGTAITISLVTIAAVTGRELALFTATGKSKATQTIYDICAIGGAFVIIVFGVVLLSSTFAPTRPF